MTIGNMTAISNNNYNSNVSKIESGTPKFVIPNDSKQQSETSVVMNGNEVDPIDTMESMTGQIAANESSYTVTDEEAEYFRKKYGENYDEDIVHKLYYELVDKGIISRNAACEASGSVGIIPLSALKSVTYAGSGEGYGLEMYMDMDLGFFSNMMFIKDICRTDDDAYKNEWDKFMEEYDREKTTWQDYLQESIDFEMYLKEIAQNSTTGKHYPSQSHFDDVIEDLEKTKNVIDRIFN